MSEIGPAPPHACYGMVHLESTCSPKAFGQYALSFGEQLLMWLFLAGIDGWKALERLCLRECKSLSSLPEGDSPTLTPEQQLFRMVQLLSESFGQ